MAETEKLCLESKDLVAERVEEMRELFPEAFTEDGIDFDKLRLILGDEVDEGEERYAFTWPGKAAAIRQSQTVSTATLRPCEEESVSADGTPGSWEDTENLYIEGDNLEVLKLLQAGYHGKADFIYIDPPYNTGSDFVYKDSFGDSIASYKEQTGQTSQSNAKTGGRFHSNWCTLMYPRLRLARELMTPDGVIAISIDDAEQTQLKLICDEVFGPSNFVANLVYDKNRKNDAKYFSVGHEYMLVYFKNAEVVKESGVVWRAQKDGVEEAKELFEQLKEEHGSDWSAIREGFKEWYGTFEEDDPRKPLARFTKVDEKGPYRSDGNSSWPGGGGPRYDVLHPVTGKPCKVPSRGWVYGSPERMQEEINKGHVVFGRDETTVPSIRTNLFEQDTQVMRSVKFSYAQTATQQLIDLFDGKKVFDNPKAVSDIAELVRYVCGDKKAATIVDFFSGSATTAHAVMKVNAEDGGARRSVLVQLPELLEPKLEKAKGSQRETLLNAIALCKEMGVTPTLCEIGKERIRRVGKKIAAEVDEANQQLQLGEEPKKLPDIGFRVLKLDESNIVKPEPGQLLVDVVKPGRTELDIVFECMLKWGLEPSLPVERAQTAGYPVWEVAAGELVCCMAPGLTVEALEAVAAMEPRRVLILDSVLDDTLKLNAKAIFDRGCADGTEIELRTV